MTIGIEIMMANIEVTMAAEKEPKIPGSDELTSLP